MRASSPLLVIGGAACATALIEVAVVSVILAGWSRTESEAGIATIVTYFVAILTAAVAVRGLVSSGESPADGTDADGTDADGTDADAGPGRSRSWMKGALGVLAGVGMNYVGLIATFIIPPFVSLFWILLFGDSASSSPTAGWTYIPFISTVFAFVGGYVAGRIGGRREMVIGALVAAAILLIGSHQDNHAGPGIFMFVPIEALSPTMFACLAAVAALAGAAFRVRWKEHRPIEEDATTLAE